VELAGAVVSGETAEVWEQSLGSSWWEWTVELGFSFLFFALCGRRCDHDGGVWSLMGDHEI
jgi:hypothetical protein